MKLKKAIEIVLSIKGDYPDGLHFDDVDALKLLIEAGKRVLVERPHCWGLRHPILPGETED